MTTYQHDTPHLLASQRARLSSVGSDDLPLARVVAQAIQCVPGVQGLSAGRFGTAATYGRGGRVPGVVVRRYARGQLGIEVHLVVSAAALRAALRQSASMPAVIQTWPPFLLYLAEQVRASIQATATRQQLFSAARLDVYIDNLG
ncbi:MAG TPA: hypothetical protein VFU32_04810 [Ktedonobacterales bacterium]|nr:hypothetical protein [Ktedonobacterales bacterium]